MKFRVQATHSGGRAGTIRIGDTEIETPAFMPVGTRGNVRGLLPSTLSELGYSLMLANCFHLMLRPGIKAMRRLGGIPGMTGWQDAILTDSGGFQIYSLATHRKLDADGVTFASPIDGAKVRLTPEIAMDAQDAIGAHIRMVLDWCPALPATKATLEQSVETSLRWAQRCRSAPAGDSSVFGIVQGGLDLQLRQQCLSELTGMDFEGYALGGLSVGEGQNEMLPVLENIVPLMPTDKPRYLMGVGTPEDLVLAVARGLDMFDCVLPSRNGRNGTLFTFSGRMNIRNSQYREDSRRIEHDCDCPCCSRGHGRHWLHHLFRSNDMLGPVLGTVHNLRFYKRLMQRLRTAILEQRLDSAIEDILGGWQPRDDSTKEQA